MADTLPVVETLASLLLARGWQIATAESCTGGGVASAFTDMPGSSSWFETGFVTYSNRSKVLQLGVEASVLMASGAVSEPVVLQMAAGALQQADADIAVSISGIAGPDGGSSEKPVGTVWFAWDSKAGVRRAECKHFSGDRRAVREAAVMHAITGLISLMKKIPV